METNFKIANSSDNETLLELIQEFYKVEHLPFDDNMILALAKILNDDSLGRIWLIQDGNEVIGYVVLTFGYSLEFRGRDALVDELYIRENYRRQGVGTNALKFVEDVCASVGIEALHLEVDRKNTTAQGLYRKVGFADHDRYLMTKWIAK